LTHQAQLWEKREKESQEKYVKRVCCRLVTLRKNQREIQWEKAA